MFGGAQTIDLQLRLVQGRLAKKLIATRMPFQRQPFAKGQNNGSLVADGLLVDLFQALAMVHQGVCIHIERILTARQQQTNEDHEGITQRHRGSQATLR